MLLLRSDERAARHNAPGRRQEVSSAVTNPLWMLVPWAVFAIGAGFKFWRLTTVFRKNLDGTTTKTERFRQALEQIWQKDQQVA